MWDFVASLGRQNLQLRPAHHLRSNPSRPHRNKGASLIQRVIDGKNRTGQPLGIRASHVDKARTFERIAQTVGRRKNHLQIFGDLAPSAQPDQFGLDLHLLAGRQAQPVQFRPYDDGIGPGSVELQHPLLYETFDAGPNNGLVELIRTAQKGRGHAVCIDPHRHGGTVVVGGHAGGDSVPCGEKEVERHESS